MRSSIIFNGKSSEDFGLVVEYVPASIHASRRGELITIPGRNGVIVQEDGAHETYTQTYRVWFNSRFTNNQDTFKTAREVASWLLEPSGFCRLEDTYEPGYFRFARYAGQLEVETVLRQFGRATLTFECQPQRYLKSGEMQIDFTKIGSHSAKIVKIHNIPKYVSKIKIVSTVEDTETSLQNPTTGQSVDGIPSRGTGELEEYYITEIEVEEGYTTVSVQGGRRIYPRPDTPVYFPVGDVALYMVRDDAIEEKVLSFNTDDFVIVNPTGNEAKPLLVVEQNQEPEEGEDNTESVATINGTTVTVDFTNGSVVYLDCDLHDAYYPDGSSANSAVSFTSEVDAYPTFPTFFEGEQHIIVAESMYYSVKISPRWWAL